MLDQCFSLIACGKHIRVSVNAADTLNRIFYDRAFVLLPELSVPDKPFLIYRAVFDLVLEHRHKAFRVSDVGQLVLRLRIIRFITSDAFGDCHDRIIIKGRIETFFVFGTKCSNDAILTDAFTAKCSGKRG